MLSFEDNVRAILECNFSETKEEFVEMAVRQIMRLSIPKTWSCKYKLPCGLCDKYGEPSRMQCPVDCEPWKEGEE